MRCTGADWAKIIRALSISHVENRNIFPAPYSPHHFPRAHSPVPAPRIPIPVPLWTFLIDFGKVSRDPPPYSVWRTPGADGSFVTFGVHLWLCGRAVLGSLGSRVPGFLSSWV